ncbi:MAG: hypothetical protein Q7R65_04780 [bacterium]|nr:hypothetical protein [bacterium]
MNCFIFFDTCARRRYVLSADKTTESGSGKFLSAGEKIIPDHMVRAGAMFDASSNREAGSRVPSPTGRGNL